MKKIENNFRSNRFRRKVCRNPPSTNASVVSFPLAVSRLRIMARNPKRFRLYEF